jgi:hypothetical protein
VGASVDTFVALAFINRQSKVANQSLLDSSSALEKVWWLSQYVGPSAWPMLVDDPPPWLFLRLKRASDNHKSLSKHVSTSLVMPKVLWLRQYLCGSALRQAQGERIYLLIQALTKFPEISERMVPS